MKICLDKLMAQKIKVKIKAEFYFENSGFWLKMFTCLRKRLAKNRTKHDDIRDYHSSHLK